MGFRRTIAAGLLFAGLLGFHLWDQRRLMREADARVRESSFITTKFDEISRISILRTGLVLDLRRGPEGWTIINPIQNEADPQTVRDLLVQLTGQLRTASVKIDPEERASFGLSHPPIEVSLWRGEESEPFKKFAVGSDSPVSGEVYASDDGGQGYFTISSALRDQLARSLHDYRDKSLAHFTPAEAVGLSLTAEGSTMEIEKKDDVWRIVRPEEYPAEKDRVETILREIQTTRAVDFIDTDTLELDRYGLIANPLVATISSKSGEKERRETVLVGRRRITNQGEPTYYALRQGRDQIFTVPQALQSALRPTVQDLRSRQLFTLTRDEVTTFTLDFSGLRTVLAKEGSGPWRFADGRKAEVDQHFADLTLGRLLGTRVVQYFAVQPLIEDSGLDRPLLRAEVAGSRATSQEGFETGRTVVGKESVYARRIDEAEVFTIPGDVPGAFFLTPEKFETRDLFAFDPKLAASILITAGDLTLTLKKESDDLWIGKYSKSESTFQVSPIGIQHVLRSLIDLKWDRRLKRDSETDAALITSMKLEAPDRGLQFLDAGGKELAYFGQGGQDERKVYISLRGHDNFYAIELVNYASFVNALNAILPKR